MGGQKFYFSEDIKTAAKKQYKCCKVLVEMNEQFLEDGLFA